MAPSQRELFIGEPSIDPLRTLRTRLRYLQRLLNVLCRRLPHDGHDDVVGEAFGPTFRDIPDLAKQPMQGLIDRS